VPFRIVLLEPEIPQNTGNIARTCAATGTQLHLIKPLGFSLSDRYLKRAGLDYWQYLDLLCHESYRDFLSYHGENALFFFTKNGNRSFCGLSYPPDSALVFGKESSGLPREMYAHSPERTLRIPMISESRSLNLSNAAALGLYEALRQHGFKGLR
jgi:tRNA (cytidine/uridine-2'-O-)-methyltransferase